MKAGKEELRFIDACEEYAICKTRLDEELTLCYANQGFYRLIGCTEEEFREDCANSLRQLFSEQTRGRLDDFLSCADVGTVRKGRRLVRLWNQTEKYIHYCIQVITEEEPCLICSAEDLTELKQEAEELLKENHRLSEREAFRIQLEQSANEITVEYDVEGDILYLPEGVWPDTEGRKIPQALVYWEKVRKRILADDSEKCRKVLEEALASPKKGYVDFRIQFQEERYRWYRARYISFGNR